jgi:hypothetical protein
MMLILWSGGADSTYLLWKILNSTEENHGHKIRVLSISYDQQIANSAPQRIAQENIKSFLQKKGFTNIQYIDISYLTTHQIQPGGNIQAPFWIAQAAIHLQRNEDLLTGYVYGDETLTDRVDLEHMFNAIQRLRSNNGYLLFPLRFVEKFQIYQELQEVGLLDLIYFCGEATQCQNDVNICKSCIKHHTTMWQLTHFRKSRRIWGFDPELPTEKDYIRQNKDWNHDYD